ncbi:OmpA family protein [Flavobacterium sp. GA093]|uniref:OmpA family protein n=1 Tax=Flavobacterium hydrocarbonoxydans TaxID=2683249 RepID=A0A6I4NK52_9FLAO|nr:OmpA family protein [Flavobacterium hydrocarbonoxydans]MWB93192.1 OmpA family protein [Flavobacterium hydrocarbonoxydans]
MKKWIFFTLALISFFSLSSLAQEKTINTADQKYDDFAYIDAIKQYEKVANKGYASPDVLKKLGNSYYNNSDFKGAAKWYAKLYATTKNLEPEYYYRYAQSLKSINQTERANQVLEEFYALDKKDTRGKLFIEDENYLNQIKANSGRYTIEDAGINSKYSDYGTFAYQNKIYFASARDTGNLVQRKHKWTEQHFTNLYVADLDSISKKPSTVHKFDKSINTKFNESSPVFTKDGQTVYFTRNNYLKGKKGKNAEKITLIKIYKATLENGKWTNTTALPFTSDTYSTAHPALSPDEKTLYFASDMPGTLGKSDIFKVSIDSNGEYGSPVNLGPEINTEGRESFPYVTNENEIYFASTGHPGLGGFDVFVGSLGTNGKVNNIQNIGNDINSPNDDFAYTIDPVSRRGYYSSNKDGGQGSDDIYAFLETRKLICLQELSGIVTDAKTGLILPNTKISLYDSKMVLKSTAISDALGAYNLKVNCGETYKITAERTDYVTKELTASILYINGKTDLPITLKKERCKVLVGDDLGKCFNIKLIYFDLDKSDITKAAIVDLEKILFEMHEYPTMKLDIRSHTDSRATNKYNEALSDRRAKSIISWLVQNGINADRLTGKGYGETQLVNRCADGVKCSEEEHLANRRSEFIITAL